MKDKIIFVIISFFLIANGSFCQNDFRKGFIITLEKDTIIGQVDYRSNTKNYNSCIFKGEQEEREYYPDEIFGFGYYNDKFFSSQIVEGSFVEVLVLGEISLFKSQNKYHLKKDTSVYDLESIFEEFEIDGTAGIKENNRWRQIMSYLIFDCISNPNSIVSNLRLKEKSLTELVVRYNKCKGLDFTEFKVSKPWIKYNFGATIGIARSEIQIRDKIGYVPYMDDSYNSIDPLIGVLVDISSPRITEKIAFQGEIHFIKSSYSSLVILNNIPLTEYHDSYIDLSTLSIPLSFKYSFPEKRFGLYLQGGINYDHHLISKAKLLSEIVIHNPSGNVVVTYPERSAFEINKNHFGYWGGIGILRSYQKFKVSIAIRYFEMSALNKTVDFKASNSRILINLILFKN
jgi:hypothetical protein